jgi:cation diffusion facilitator CzcD-associated flavoprotein CzcO
VYESTHFNSSKALSAFPGWPMPGHFADYPSWRHILTYLTPFAQGYGLTDGIEFSVGVDSVEKNANGTWTGGRATVHSDVVVCTGAQWHPNVPVVPGDFTGEIRHTVDYRSSAELRGKRVLVVGGGPTACDVASDAAITADHAVISMRRGYWFIPKHVFGRPADVFAEGGPQLPIWLEQKVFGAILKLFNDRQIAFVPIGKRFPGALSTERDLISRMTVEGSSSSRCLPVRTAVKRGSQDRRMGLVRSDEPRQDSVRVSCANHPATLPRSP